MAKPGRITDADIARAKEVPIDSLYDGRLRQTAGRLLGLCPFSPEKTPSFTIYAKTNDYHCFGCQAHGDVINYVMKMRNIGFLEAVKFLINK